MKREDILEISRKLNDDEGMVHAENEGRKIGFFAFSILSIAIIIFSLIIGQEVTLYATSSLFWAFMAAEAFAKYRFSKKKVYLTSTVAGSIAFCLLYSQLYHHNISVMAMEDKLVLKNRLKVARAEKCLSQTELAEIVGVSRNTISSIETGQFNPTARLALILCIALDKKFEDLFYFD